MCHRSSYFNNYLILWNLKLLSLFALALLMLPSSYLNVHENDINNKSLSHKCMVDTSGTIIHILAQWTTDGIIVIKIIINFVSSAIGKIIDFHHKKNLSLALSLIVKLLFLLLMLLSLLPLQLPLLQILLLLLFLFLSLLLMILTIFHLLLMYCYCQCYCYSCYFLSYNYF